MRMLAKRLAILAYGGLDKFNPCYEMMETKVTFFQLLRSDQKEC